MKRCFIEIDLVQAEWVVTAYVSQDARMLDVVHAEADPHTRTGSLISGAPESFVIFENELIGHTTDPTEIARARSAIPAEWEGVPTSQFFYPRIFSIRQAGKKSNHGLNYNMGYRRFALENGMEEREAKDICAMYRDIAYPGLKRYYTLINQQLRNSNRRLTNCFGQTRQFRGEWGTELLDAAYAFLPQSTVGNVTNFGMRGIYHDYRLRDVQLGAQQHDSLLNQHNFSSWTELADQVIICDHHMSTPCAYHGQIFTLRRDIKLGLDWGEDSMIKVDFDSPDVLPVALEKAWERSSASRAA
jgi:hypothetical protein